MSRSRGAGGGGAPPRMLEAAKTSFLGVAPRAYKVGLVAALALNLALRAFAGPRVAAWAVVAELIATLALALECYPLAPGGLLALEALGLGLTTPAAVYGEVQAGLSILLLLVFMVPAVGFLRELLVVMFSRLLTVVSSRIGLALTFFAVSALLSAFLDALTVIAVVITVGLGFYRIYFTEVSGRADPDDAEPPLATAVLSREEGLPALSRERLGQLRAALRSLSMHAAVGTAAGGVGTLVGEPQNLLIGHAMGWTFGQFAREMAGVSLPVLAVGLGTCALVERFRLFGFGAAIPGEVRRALVEAARRRAARRGPRERVHLGAQALVAALLVAALALHVAEVGLIGLGVVVLATAFRGVTEEHELADAMKTALPFTALVVVFLAIIAVIHDQQLFGPVIELVLARQGRTQVALLYLANGALSAISDNVFVATIYMSELGRAFAAGLVAPEQYARLAVAVNAGTNVPSIATPNGQAAFLFLLTSGAAPLFGLSYRRMALMTLPYFVTMAATGLLAVTLLAG